MSRKIRAYSYLRFSSPEQAKGDSFRRQTALAINYARLHNLMLDESLTFHDLGVSAYQGVNSETGQLGTLLEAVQTGLIPVGSKILVESLDRISRQTARKALRVIESILESGVSVVTLTDGREYTSENLDRDPLSLLLALLTFIRANEESNTKSNRLAAVWAQKRQVALEKPLTAKCPGWIKLSPDRKTFVLIPEHAATVRRIFNEALSGKGVWSITRGLNIDGIPIQRGGGRKAAFWQMTSIALLLKNQSVIGTMTPRGCRYIDGKLVRSRFESIEGYYPAVVSVEDFEKVQILRKSPNSIDFGRRQRLYPLYNIFGKLSRCALCGSAMVYCARTGRTRYLLCRRVNLKAGCEYGTVRYHDLEDSVRRVFSLIISEQAESMVPVVRQRFNTVQDLLQLPVVNRPALNAGLRAISKSVEINPFELTLKFNWKHGTSSVIEAAFKPIEARERTAVAGEAK